MKGQENLQNNGGYKPDAIICNCKNDGKKGVHHGNPCMATL
jgi:hypothetical protein